LLARADLANREAQKTCLSLFGGHHEFSHHAKLSRIIPISFDQFSDSSRQENPNQARRKAEQLIIMAPFMCHLFGKNMSKAK
jgi:hypothetical protein